MRAITGAAFGVLLLAAGQAQASVLIVGARVVDGTGAPARETAVRIDGGRITGIGALKAKVGETVVDARGQVLAPGFIDTHSHHSSAIPEHPDLAEVVSQGITTIVVGQDGGSNTPLKTFFAGLEAKPAAVNVASYTGHNTVRGEVMGEDYKRLATSAEIAAMAKLVEADMEAGAIGLSSGLEYDPGIYSSKDEVVTLAKAAARHGGRYISHVRSEDRKLVEALDEVVEIGRATGMPVQVSHWKLAMVQLWGQADAFTARLDKARAQGVDITADVYPYEYWQADLTVMFPDRNFKDRTAAEFAVTSITTPEGLLMSGFTPDPSVVGKTLAQISKERGTDPAQTLMDMIAEMGDKGDSSIIATSMDGKDIAKLIAWPHSNICSDGNIGGMHPRGAGAFTKVLRKYVREDKVLTLEQAIHKMSGLSAAHMGFTDRGQIREGYVADLVLFDPATVSDRSAIGNPGALSVGISEVWVAGEPVWVDGKTTGKHPGRVVRRR